MANASGIRAGRAFVELFADDSKLVRGLHSAEKKLKAFGKATKEIGEKMMLVGGAITAPLLAAAHGFAKAGSEMAEMSERTGMSVEALSAFKFMASQTGVELEDVGKAIRFMQRGLYQAAMGSGAAKKAFAQLGLSVADLARMSPEEQFKAIAQAISKVQDPTIRTGMAMAIFGRAGTAMLPMLMHGADGMNKMTAEAASLGLIMSQGSAEAAHKFEKRLNILELVAKALRNAIGSALVPALTDMANKFIACGAVVVKWVKQHQDVVVQVMRTGTIIVGVGGALVGLGYAFTGLAKGLGVLASAVSSGIAGVKLIGSVIAWALSPTVLLAAGIIALGAYLVYASGVGGAALAWLADRFGTLFQDASESWKAIGDALAKGDIGKAAQVLWATLKMEWQRGVSAVEEVWAGFSSWLLTIQETVVNAMVVGWINGFAAIKTAFVEFDAWYRTKQEELAGWLAKKMVQFENAKQETDRKQTQEQLNRTDLSPEERGKLERHWNDIKGPAADTDTQTRIIDQSRVQKLKEISDSKAAALKSLQEDQKNQLAGAASAHSDALAKIDQEKKAKLDAAQAELDAAQKAWKESLTPSGKPTLTGSGSAAPKMDKSLKDLKNLSLLDLSKKVEAKGSFNVAESRSLGAGGLQDRIAAATEQTAANTQKIVDDMGDGAEFE